MRSIITEFEAAKSEHPDRLLYSFLDIKGSVKESYTYSGFDVRARCIAAYIQENYSFQVGDRVLLAYPSGLEMICAFFACVRLGLLPVPVYPPSESGFEAAIFKMKFIAEDCHASAILTTKANKLSAQLNLARMWKGDDEQIGIIKRIHWVSTDEISNSRGVEFQEAYSPILFLQYTSGSTNDPKGVIITHENLLDNCKNVVDHRPVGVSWLPQYHDMGLIGYYLFFALKGGTTYGFSPRDFILNPSLWLETITKYKCSATSAPSFAFEYCLQPGRISQETLDNLDLTSLRFVMNAAEPVKVDAFDQFIEKFSAFGLKRDSAFAAYGLAENTLAVSNYGRTHKVFNTELLKEGKAVVSSSDNGTKLMSCGKPLGDTKVRIVGREEAPIDLGSDEVGEIWVTGSSKGYGYWGRPDLTNERFKARIDGNEEEWLRTGDLGFIHGSELYICGRVSDMIIIHGLNYYPQDIEAIIEEDPRVRKGCVAAFAEDDDKLVAVIGVKNKNRLPDIGNVNSKVLQFSGIVIDQAIFVLARDVARTSSGKIRRGKNKELFKEERFHVLKSYSSVLEGASPAKGTTSAVDELFNRYGLKGTETSAFGDSGLDSLKLAEFAHDLKQVIIRFRFDDLAEEIDLRIIQKIAVSELYDVLLDLYNSNRLGRYRFKRIFERIHKEYRHIEKEMMRRDAQLNSSQWRLDQVKDWSQEGHVLLTGGTGFFGPFLIKSLLEQQKDDIYVLVRTGDREKGLDRLKAAFKTIGCSADLQTQFENRVRVIPGDLEMYHLGTSDEDWSFLARNIHTVYHNGAMVNYLLDYESMRPANVEGTNEVLRLISSFRLKELNYISTTFIFGWSTKDVLYESDSNATMDLLDFGYSQSKWVSEQIVEQARQGGLPIRVFRPALISPSIDGQGYNFDIAVRLLAFMVKYGIDTTASNQVSFSPADLAANNIVAISSIQDSINKTFHVTRDEYSSMLDVTAILSRLTGKAFEHFELKEFVPEVVSRCEKDDILFPLLNFLVRSVDNISSMEFKRYDNGNYIKYRNLSPNGMKDPPLEDVVSGIYTFLINNDLIK